MKDTQTTQKDIQDRHFSCDQNKYWKPNKTITNNKKEAKQKALHKHDKKNNIKKGNPHTVADRTSPDIAPGLHCLMHTSQGWHGF